MFRIYENKVPKELKYLKELHNYFCDIERFQELPRYPKKKIFLLPIDPNYLKILDYTYCSLICAIPRTFWKTELELALSGENQSGLKILRRENDMIRFLRKNLGIKIEFNPKSKG